MTGPSESDLVTRTLKAYDLGDLESWAPHGGTAGKTWRVVTTRGAWLFRMRGVRTSSDEVIAFDHGLRRRLLEAGIPTTAPVPACDGCMFTRVGERVIEVYPFLPGRSLTAVDSDALGNVAQALARFHQAAAGWPDARALPPVAQYSTVGVADRNERMEDPELLARVYSRLASQPGAEPFGDAVDASRRWLTRLRSDYDRAVYDALPHTVTHGDFTLANLLFDQETSVKGIFDFDWARWAPRVRDIADGTLFIAGQRRTPMRPGDIWSLTEAVSLHVERCLRWVRSYQTVAPLNDAEISVLPLAMAARWLSVRVEGTAKVPEAERLRFCFGNVAEPLLWLEENWPVVARALSPN